MEMPPEDHNFFKFMQCSEMLAKHGGSLKIAALLWEILDPSQSIVSYYALAFIPG